MRELCPHSQVVQREAYRPIEGSADPDSRFSQIFMHENECKTVDHYSTLFATHGIHPNYWICFCEAFVWAMQTHCPYSQEEDNDDLAQQDVGESVYAKFVAGSVALPMIEAYLRRATFIKSNAIKKLESCFSEECMKSSLLGSFENVVNDSFSHILAEYPDLEDYFSASERDQMGMNLTEM